MKTLFTILLLYFLLPNFGNAQQVWLRQNENQWLSDYTLTYAVSQYIFMDSRFIYNKEAEFYSARNVKQVEVLTKNGVPLYRVRLNKDGSIKNVGFQAGNFYKEEEEIRNKEDDLITITKYFEKNVLVRIDSIFHYSKNYINEDSNLVIVFTRQENYRVGYLINDRNRYYNENYLGIPIDYDQMSTIYFRANFNLGGEIPEINNYYDVAFKTNYDSLKLFHCSSSTDVVNRYGNFISSNSYIEVYELNHPFFRDHNNFKTDYYTDGSDFREPSFYRPRTFCSVYPYDAYPVDYGYRSGYHYDDKGLITEYYNEFYPEDTAATRLARIEAKRNEEQTLKPENNFAVLDYPGFNRRPIVVRSKTPRRVDTYLYRYEFYE